MSRGSKLTVKQEAFAREYIVDLNGKLAAIRAGYSPNGAEVTASKLLTVTKVKALVQELMDKRVKRTEIKADSVLTRLDQIGDVDPALAYDEHGCFKSIHDIPLEVRKCIASVKVREEFDSRGNKTGEVIEVKFWDKIKANELLGKNQKLFTEHLKITHERKLVDIIIEAGAPHDSQKDVTNSNSRDAAAPLPVRKALQGKRE